jgi:hypothetical protein
VVRRGGGARQRAEGKLSRSFFLSSLGDAERVRIVKCYGGGRYCKVGVFASGNRGSRGGASEGGDVDEGVQGGQEGCWASSGLEVEGVIARRRSYGPKDIFGRVLEFRGRRATGRKEIIEGGDA